MSQVPTQEVSSSLPTISVAMTSFYWMDHSLAPTLLAVLFGPTAVSVLFWLYNFTKLISKLTQVHKFGYFLEMPY